MSIDDFLGKFKTKWSKGIAIIIVVIGIVGVYAGVNFWNQLATEEVTCVVNKKGVTTRKNETEAYEVTCDQKSYYIYH